MTKKTKRPRDTNQLAKNIVDIATGEVKDIKNETKEEIKSAAALLGRKGGLKGGLARANALTSKRRSQIARKAAKARWKKN